MKASLLVESKYLTKEDVGSGTILKIRGIKKVNLAKENEPPEMKWIMGFAGNNVNGDPAKPMVLNSTNIQLITMIHGEETDNWVGKELTLWNDPSVSFGSKLTGGVRVKPVTQQPVREQNPPDDFDDDIPW
jgi:hypothetical protein